MGLPALLSLAAAQSLPTPSGKKVLVTGCSTGAGRALAVEFARRGCHVLATARSLHAIDDLPILCTSNGLPGAIETARVDVCDMTTLVEAIAAFGPVDVAVANAGMSGFAPLIEQPLETFDQVHA